MDVTSMSASLDRLEVLYRTPDEMEAAMIADVLADHGIRSSVTGGATAGFRAEAPGEVRILIAEAHLPLARRLLEQHLHESQPVDWEQVDCHDPTTPEGEEVEPPAPAELPANSAKLQFSLG